MVVQVMVLIVVMNNKEIKMKNRKGFTLVETLIGATMVGVASAGALTVISENNKSDAGARFINEASSIVEAVDHRIAIDGYSATSWNRLSWMDEGDITNDLINKELVSRYVTSCNGGDWEPNLTSEKEVKLLECELWKNRKQNGVNMKADFYLDTLGFIEEFELLLGFDDQESFEKNFKYMRKEMLSLQNTKSREISGEYDYTLKSATTGMDISTTNCIRSGVDCQLSLSLNRNGGDGYIRVDGESSLVNTHLNFLETKDDAPMKCVRWKNTQKDGSGAWTMSPVPGDDCGIGIYEDLGHPAVVEVAVHNGTMKNVLLNQDCNVYQKTTFGVSVNSTSPCGMLEEAGEIIQVVDNIHANEIFADESAFSVVSVDRLIAEEISTNTLTITNLAKFDTLEITNDAQFSGATTLEDNVDVQLNTTFSKDVDADDVVFGREVRVINDAESDTKMKAPIGNFNNIDAEINLLKSTLQNLESSVGSNWLVSGWGSCSKSCGGGTKTRSVYCPSNKICPVNGKPSSTATCNTQRCTASWVTGGWGSCNRSCGGGTKTRSVYCPSGYSCPSSKPSTSTSCNTQSCGGTWVYKGINYGSSTKFGCTGGGSKYGYCPTIGARAEVWKPTGQSGGVPICKKGIYRCE